MKKKKKVKIFVKIDLKIIFKWLKETILLIIPI